MQFREAPQSVDFPEAVWLVLFRSRRSPQQISVIQPRSIWQRAVTSRGSRCHAAALPRRPGAPGNGSCPARIRSAVPGEDGAPQLPFPEPPLASVSLVLSWCYSWSHLPALWELPGTALSQPSRASHTRPGHPSARWEGLCPLWGHTWLCFHGGTAPLGRSHQVSVASCHHRCDSCQLWAPVTPSQPLCWLQLALMPQGKD